MASPSIAARSKRPKQQEPEDAVLVRLVQVAEWTRRNVTLVATIGVVLILLVGGLLWYRTDRARRNDAAAVAFLPVEQSVLGGDPTVAARELDLFIQRHGSSHYGDEARVLLAQVQLRAGRTAEAIEAVQSVAADIDSPLGPQAAQLLAAAQEVAGQRAEAIQTYLRVADQSENRFHQEAALLGAARLQEEAGEFAAAAESYRRLIELTNEASPERSLYEMRATEAEARASLPE
jgi:predicted negative regulator of RcsB-dependent stress response